MENERINKILGEVASENGVSVEEVLFEMEFVISQAYHNAMLSNDQALHQLWNEIPRNGDVPTPIEMIDFLSKKALDESGNVFVNTVLS